MRCYLTWKIFSSIDSATSCEQHHFKNNQCSAETPGFQQQILIRITSQQFWGKTCPFMPSFCQVTLIQFVIYFLNAF